MQSELIDIRLERALRYRADRLGLALRKSRVRCPHLDDLGGWRIVNADGNWIIDGARFELDLDDVRAFLDRFEQLGGTSRAAG